VLQWGRQENLYGQVVLITGGSRGLGLALAREFARVGCRLVLAARDAQELARARQDLTQRGTEVLAVPCDVTDQEQVRSLVEQATQRFGRVDIVVNNAGIIQVGPMSTTTVEDFANALDVMFWGTLYPTLAVLPQMRARRSGHVVNITSIGGMVSIPHLLPYTCAKFGLSEGLRAELGQEGIHVTTVVPGLMVNIRLTHGQKSAAEHHVITAPGLIGQDDRVTLDTRSAPIGQANATRVRFGSLPVEPSCTGFEVGEATL